ncbi:hypothetical protein HRbin19_00885 [bacterium HR19]|nr:hypothetical protein HRbin19_00885 [bacterium HR19]
MRSIIKRTLKIFVISLILTIPISYTTHTHKGGISKENCQVCITSQTAKSIALTQNNFTLYIPFISSKDETKEPEKEFIPEKEKKSRSPPYLSQS